MKPAGTSPAGKSPGKRTEAKRARTVPEGEGRIPEADAAPCPRSARKPRKAAPPDPEVRRERIEEAEATLRGIVSDFEDRPVEESLRRLTVLILRMAALGLAEGSVGIKDIDLPKLLAALPDPARGAGGADAGAGKRDKRDRGTAGLSDAAASAIRRKILGVGE